MHSLQAEPPQQTQSMSNEEKPPRYGLAPGVQVDHYEITALLGEGGESTAAKAIDLKNGKNVVMKFFDPLRLGDIATYEHFRRAVAIGRLLEHPGIPRVIEVREDTNKKI